MGLVLHRPSARASLCPKHTLRAPTNGRSSSARATSCWSPSRRSRTTPSRQPRHGRLVLAEGEATGHAHAIAEPDAREFRVGDERFVLVRSAAQLIHEEHATIDLPPGAYRVVIQREYEPAPLPQNAWRRVID